MLKMSYASYIGLSPAISLQFTLEMCTAAKNCEKFSTNPYFKGSRSFKFIDVDKSSRKFELMLTRRAKAYSNSGSVV